MEVREQFLGIHSFFPIMWILGTELRLTTLGVNAFPWQSHLTGLIIIVFKSIKPRMALKLNLTDLPESPKYCKDAHF